MGRRRTTPRAGRATLCLRHLSEDASRSRSEVPVLREEPPLPVRALLVGSTTALMTPLFPVIGFNQLVFRYATPEMKMALHGGTSMLYFSAMTLMPNAFYYAPILLPFAIGNGVTAGAFYLGADLLAGGPKVYTQGYRPPECRPMKVTLAASADCFAIGYVVLAIMWRECLPAYRDPKLKMRMHHLPPAHRLMGLTCVDPRSVNTTFYLAGPLLGLATAFAVPFTYPHLWNLVYSVDVFEDDIESANKFIFNACFNSWFGPCLATTGVASGLIIHAFLRPVILGVPGWPWPRLAGGVLRHEGLPGGYPGFLYCLRIGLVALYSASARSGFPHLRDADLEDPNLRGWLWNSRVSCTASDEDFCWVPRLNLQSAEVMSQSLRPSDFRAETLQFCAVGDAEPGLGQTLQAKQLRQRAQQSTARCFASTRDAYWWDVHQDLAKRPPLEAKDLQRLEASLPLREYVMADALILFLLGSELHPILGTAKVTPAALADELLGLRSAQFRDAGLKPGLVQQGLETTEWKFADSRKLREADWDIIAEHRQREAYRRAATQVAVGGTFIAALVLCWLRLSRDEL
ncbi:hypothetical protein AK812_SmicGene6364 [Symbiodinium microadriaticum]|uniref:Uncharacterized protein n=1 Tax=Symbiodinium microadriaticum TaxID=2951 RepID=A0A1Q9ERB8_SYMMI|nr:hypothetical protein AK812_SmicGene6364 [Symbiodinium microadriaticum]